MAGFYVNQSLLFESIPHMVFLHFSVLQIIIETHTTPPKSSL